LFKTVIESPSPKSSKYSLYYPKAHILHQQETEPVIKSRILAKKFQCKFCEKYYSSIGSLQNHQSVSHRTRSRKLKQNVINPETNISTAAAGDDNPKGKSKEAGDTVPTSSSPITSEESPPLPLVLFTCLRRRCGAKFVSEFYYRLHITSHYPDNLQSYE